MRCHVSVETLSRQRKPVISTRKSVTSRNIAHNKPNQTWLKCQQMAQGAYSKTEQTEKENRL